MKFLSLLVGLQLVAFSATAKKHSITETQYEIEGAETGTQGTYLVKVHVYTQEKTATTDEFKFAAVHGVIFRGFSGKGFSAQKPMARPEALTQHADFFSAFFDNGDYRAYATVINPATNRVKLDKKRYKITATVSVSKDELRRALESAGIIRSLNSGF